MSFKDDILNRPFNISVPSKYTTLNGHIYFISGLIFLVWPGLVQTLFQDPAFAGHEEALFRLVGLLLAANGWLYIFGGLSDTRARTQ